MKINIQTLSEISQVDREIKLALKRYINANLGNKMSAFSKVIPCKFLLYEDFIYEEEFLEQEMNQQDYVELCNIDYSDENVNYVVYGEVNGNEFEYSFYTKLDSLMPYINKKFI